MKKQATSPPNHFPDLFPGGQKLGFVNADKFNQNDLVNKLNWSSINPGPITDAEGIRTRQDSLKLFLSSNIMSRFLDKSFVTPSEYYGKDFFERYGKGSLFNVKTRGLTRALTAATAGNPNFIPSTSLYSDLVTQLTVEHDEISATEDKLVSVLHKELKHVYSYNGVVKIKSMLTEGAVQKLTHSVYGFKDYSFHKKDLWLVAGSKFICKFWKYTPKNYYGMLGIRLLQFLFCWVYLLASILPSLAEKSKNDSLYTRELPVSVETEIRRINRNFTGEIRRQLIDRLQKMKTEVSNDAVLQSVRISTEFQFVLTPEDKFVLRLIDVNSTTAVPDEFVDLMNKDWGNPFELSNTIFEKGSSLYSLIIKKIFRWRARKQSNEAARKFVKLPLMHALESALVTSRDLLSKGREVVSTAAYQLMLDEVKYSNVRDAIDGLGLTEEWEQINTFRQKVSNLFASLRSVNEKAKRIEETKKKFSNFPFCFPTVLDDDKNIVSFNNLIPLHLLGTPNKDRSKNLEEGDLRPIVGLPALNGQILSITGQNGGGKTVVETELIHALNLAHMGFPVFADHFTMNAKDTIAMVFVEKGTGSMLQLLMEKLKIVAEVVEANPNNKVVVILDELLTGTQEEDGFEIGCQYLNMLNNKKCSVLFVTQITKLAEYAKTHLGALCYHFEKDGSMKEGIGKGNAAFLAEEVGLNKFLQPELLN